MKKTIWLSALGLALTGCVSVTEMPAEPHADIAEEKPQAAQNADVAMEDRTIPFEPNVIVCGILDPSDVEPKSNATCPEERALQEQFSSLFGVTWPVGSSVTLIRSARPARLRVRNTVENLDLLESGLETLSLIPTMMDVQVRFVEVDQKTLDAVGAELVPGKAADHRYDIADFEDVPAAVLERTLIARRDLLLNAAPKVMTRDGEEAVLKAVSECIYPTDYEVQMGEMAGDGVDKEPRVRPSGIATVEPQCFTMREVGTILDVTPTLMDDGCLVGLKVNVQFVDEPEWTDYGMQLPSPKDGTYALPMKQPFFPVRSIDTSVAVSPGETVLAGAIVSVKKSDVTQLVFLRVRKVDTRGRPVKDK